jgi:hypothetical protein
MSRVPKSERYEWLSSKAEPPLPFAYEPFFFNHPEYIAFQPRNGLREFYLLDLLEQATVAHLPVWISNKEAISPLRGTFGSVQLKAGLSPEILTGFLNFCLEELKRESVQNLSLRHYPESYCPAEAAVGIDALLRIGCTVVQSQLSHFLNLNDAFETRLHSSAKRRLQKCRKAGFTFQQEDLTALETIYDFAAHCREEQGKSLSLSKEQLRRLVQAFPDRYLLFSVREGEKIIAATVAVSISSEVLYNFYPSSLQAYNDFSPSVLLHSGLHSFARSAGYRIIDLGISSIPGDPYYSLMEFKSRIGGIPSLKMAFAWENSDQKLSSGA